MRCRECGTTGSDKAIQDHIYNWHIHENHLRFPGGEQVTLVRLPERDNKLLCPNPVCGRLIGARRTMKNHIMNHCLYVLQGQQQQRRQPPLPPPPQQQHRQGQRPVSSRPQIPSTPRSTTSASTSASAPPGRRSSISAPGHKKARQGSASTQLLEKPRAQPYPPTRPKSTSSKDASRSDRNPSHSSARRDDPDLSLVKKEGTMIEIDLNDVDEGVLWTNVGDGVMMMGSYVPTVDIYEVPNRVRQGDEVWAKCRIARLGKFAVTSRGLLMDFELVSHKKPSSKNLEQQRPTVHARVESGVVESLLDHSSSELAQMVANKKMLEFHKAVRNLRDKLENLGQIECRFQGMQDNAVIVRELDAKK
ncbi:hypothetical protein BGW41_006757 [Actinomortierella wolfii]|nr:hypothetical protein BGW41_006757 [Actinomortierella wolfii]